MLARQVRATEPADGSLDVAGGMIQLSGLIQGIYTRVSDRHELTPVQAKLLCLLIERPRGMAELARILGVEKAALTGLMDRVERRGLAQRAAVPGDRRALQVTLTAAGRKAATAFHRDVGAQLDALVDELTPTDRELFRSTVAGIVTRCRTSCAPKQP